MKKQVFRKELSNLSLYKVNKVHDRCNPNVFSMDLNENFLVDREEITKMLFEAVQTVDVRRYPTPYGEKAAKTIADYLKLDVENITIGNGADELLETVLKVFIKTSPKVLVIEPTFSMYTHFIKVYGGKKIPVFLSPTFELNLDAIYNKLSKDISVIFICSPNNPTGNQFKKENVERILTEFKGIVVVDEAYVDFAEYSVVDWIKDFDNLLVLRTFSKAFGLAGLRCGYMVSSKEIGVYVKKAMSPFNANSINQKIIPVVLKRWSYFKDKIDNLKKERLWMFQNLTSIKGVLPFSSNANFILFKINKQELSSATVTTQLLNKQILVKDFGAIPMLSNCIRVTVGPREINEFFLSELEKLVVV